MKLKRSPLLVCLSLFFALSIATGAMSKVKVEELYTQHCVVCHGENLDGGLGSSLIDGEWAHGGTREEILLSIKNGQPQLEMPAFANTLSDAEINALAVYISEQEHNALRKTRSEPKPVGDKVINTEHHDYRVEYVVDGGLKTPWSMTFLPDGRALVTERPGSLRVIEKGKLNSQPIANTPESWERGQGGLMEVALHPDYANNGWIYLAYNDKLPNKDEGFTKIVRGRLKGNNWVDEETIWQVPAEFYSGSGAHYGVRLVFHPDGYLYFGVGDRGRQDQAQDLTRPNGKIHRIHPDGRIPNDNPFAKQRDAFPSIWTYGNRNPQGLVLHPTNGEIWETEHGPRGGDELNLMQAGKNYGWPVISYGMNYNGTPVTEITSAPGMEQPVHYWTPSIAVCGIDFYTGKQFPEWQNDLFIGGLKSQELWRFRLANGKVTEQELILKGIGKVRDVYNAPDGHLYVILNGPDRILRLVPVE